MEAARRRANDLLAQLGLAAQAHHAPSRLDAGQSQRVAIARALIGKPKLVVADEPLSRQDSGCARMITELFAREQREHGTAFLVSTRDQRQLSRASSTFQLTDGRLLRTSADAARKPLRVYL
jgi:predicted ABC-type transport system involved in lysophospholipase L1 biosynthesis ATPase subunit